MFNLSFSRYCIIKMVVPLSSRQEVQVRFLLSAGSSCHLEPWKAALIGLSPILFQQKFIGIVPFTYFFRCPFLPVRDLGAEILLSKSGSVVWSGVAGFQAMPTWVFRSLVSHIFFIPRNVRDFKLYRFFSVGAVLRLNLECLGAVWGMVAPNPMP